MISDKEHRIDIDQVALDTLLLIFSEYKLPRAAAFILDDLVYLHMLQEVPVETWIGGVEAHHLEIEQCKGRLSLYIAALGEDVEPGGIMNLVN
jgi:hypothetical protein